MGKITKLESVKKAACLPLAEHLQALVKALNEYDPDTKDLKVKKVVCVVETEDGDIFPMFYPIPISSDAMYMLEVAKYLIMDSAMNSYVE